MLNKTKRLFVLSALVIFVLFLVACREETKALTFAGGEGVTGSAPDSVSLKEGYQLYIPENTFTKEGHVFVGWTDGTNDYQPGEIYVVGATDVTFTAKWVMTPTSITVECNTATVGENGAVLGDEDFQLEAYAFPEGASNEFIWTSSSKNIATVDNGAIKTVSPGKTTITVTSKYDSNVKATFEVVVWPAESKNEVLLAANNAIKASIPTYIDQSFEFDLLYPDLITYEISSLGTGKVYEDAIYEYELKNGDFDTSDTIQWIITYDGTSFSTSYEILIVGNAENNDYIELEYVQEQLDELFEEYKEDKVTNDLELPLSFEGHDTISLNWATSNGTVLNIASVENDPESTDTITHCIGDYARPNDDTEVTLTATVVITHQKPVDTDGDGSADSYEDVITNGSTMRFKVVVNGYSKEEKLAAIKEEVVPTSVSTGTIEMTNVNLPVIDSKFQSTITWTSSDPTKLSNDGKFLSDAEAEVTLTMRIVYTSPITANCFDETIEYPVSLALSDNAAVVAAFRYQSSDDYKALQEAVSYFPYGKEGREGNVLTLPTSFTHNDTTATLTWSCSEEGLFDETWELQKQYLRYHEVTLTGTVTVGSDVATIEVKSNVGISQLLRTSHIAGCFSRLSQQGDSKNLLVCMDAMPVMSAFDAAVGNMCGSKYYGGYYCPINLITEADGSQHIYVGSNDVYDAKSVYVSNSGSLGVGQTGGFAGLTYYYDITSEDGEVTRFQYYFSEAFTWVVTNENVDANGDLKVADGQEKFLSMAGRQHQQYGYITIINNSDRDVKIPIFYYSIPNTAYPKDINGSSARDASISFDGDEYGFVADKDGKVVYASVGSTSGLDAATAPMFVTIPAGGFMWNAGGGQSDNYSTLALTYFMEVMCTLDMQVTIEKWDVHPFNSIIEFFKNDVTLPLPNKDGDPVVRNFWGY